MIFYTKSHVTEHPIIYKTNNLIPFKVLVAQSVRASTRCSEGRGFNPTLETQFFFTVYLCNACAPYLDDNKKKSESKPQLGSLPGRVRICGLDRSGRNSANRKPKNFDAGCLSLRTTVIITIRLAQWLSKATRVNRT